MCSIFFVTLCLVGVVALSGGASGVSAGAPAIILEGSELQLNAGDMLNISCRDNQPIAWCTDHRLTTDPFLETYEAMHAKPYVSTLTISEVNFTHVGFLTCLHKTTQNRQEGTCDITHPDVASVYLYVKDETHLLAKEAKRGYYSATVGQPFNLPCKPTFPNVTIKLDQFSSISNYDPHYGFTATSEDPLEVYTCFATYEDKSYEKHMVVNFFPQSNPAPVTFTPTPAPELRVDYYPPSQRATVTEGGEDAVFTCHARGSPPPSVTWYREGEVMGEGEELRVEARRNNAGQYVCVATNGISQDQSATFTLAVEYLEVEAVLPRVVVRGREMEATLSCRVHGHPTPEVVWHRSGSTHLETGHSPDQPDLHHLQLENLVPGDLGDYQCHVHTHTTQDMDTVTLVSVPGPARVLGVRPWPRRPQVTITWEVDSLAPIVSYDSTLVKVETEEVLEVRSEATPVEEDGIRFVLETVLSLDPGTTYDIDLQAVNTQGQVGPEMDTPFTFTIPHLTRLPATDGGSDKEHTCKLLKTMLNMLSRLLGVARTTQ